MTELLTPPMLETDAWGSENHLIEFAGMTFYFSGLSVTQKRLISLRYGVSRSAKGSSKTIPVLEHNHYERR